MDQLHIACRFLTVTQQSQPLIWVLTSSLSKKLKVYRALYRGGLAARTLAALALNVTGALTSRRTHKMWTKCVKPFVHSLNVLVEQTRLLQHCVLSYNWQLTRPRPSLLWSPSPACRVVLEQRALPFGSTVSVHAFCRLSEAIRTLLLLLFMIVNIAFFDQIGMVDSEETCDRAVFAAEVLLDALGLSYSVKAAKLCPFSESFKILDLGAELTLNVLVADHYAVQVSNTQEPADEIMKEVNTLLAADAKRLPFSESFKILGAELTLNVL
eukprot:413930-Amphidinium_carterae.1